MDNTLLNDIAIEINIDKDNKFEGNVFMNVKDIINNKHTVTIMKKLDKINNVDSK